MDETAQRIIQRFELRPHPEGGFFREVYRSDAFIRHPDIPEGEPAQRSCGTFIYYLLADDQISAFHRVRWTDEIWHLYAGGPLELHVIDDEDRYRVLTLTTRIEEGEPSAVIPSGWWQAARLPPGTPWAFGGCTVAPGFDFADFEMPPSQELLARFPQHASLIRALGKR
jgi:predicted cupin superfamily sugar epimerase